jgi:hypothetical protein
MTRAATLWIIAMLVLGTACVGLERQLGIERGRTRLETDRVQRLQAELRSVENAMPRETSPASGQSLANSAARPASAALSSPPPSAPVAGMTPIDPNSEQEQRLNAMRKAQEQMFADPEGRKLALSEAKTNIRAEYPELMRHAHLSAEEEDQLVTLMANQMFKTRELYAQARASGTPAFSEADFERRQRTEATEIAALIGEERFQQFSKYKESLPERQRVTAFQATLDAENALKSEDAERLISALATERQRIEEKRKTEPRDDTRGASMGFAGGAFITFDPSAGPDAAVASATSQVESYDRGMARIAAPMLTSAQQKAFEAFQKERRESMLAHMRMSMTRMRQAELAKPQ